MGRSRVSFFLFCFGSGAWARVPSQAKHMLYHQGTPSPTILLFIAVFFNVPTYYFYLQMSLTALCSRIPGRSMTLSIFPLRWGHCSTELQCLCGWPMHPQLTWASCLRPRVPSISQVFPGENPFSLPCNPSSCSQSYLPKQTKLTAFIWQLWEGSLAPALFNSMKPLTQLTARTQEDRGKQCNLEELCFVLFCFDRDRVSALATHCL